MKRRTWTTWVLALMSTWLCAGQASAVEPREVLGFEDLSQWSASSGTITSSGTSSQGELALGINGPGWRFLDSVRFGPLPGQIDDSVTVDIKLPAPQPNTWWYGQLQLIVDAPSRGLFNHWVGAVELTGLPLEEFTTVEFSLPAHVQAALAGQYQDLRVTLALNLPQDAYGTYLLDNLRFADDIDPPSVLVRTAASPAWSLGPIETTSTAVTLQGLVGDDVEVASVAVSVDGAAATPIMLNADGSFELDLEIEPIPGATHTTQVVEIIAVDTSGNQTNAVVQVNYLPAALPDELVVLFRPDASPTFRNLILADIDATPVRELSELATLVTVPPGTANSAIEVMAAPNLLVRSILPNLVMRRHYVPNDSLIERQQDYLDAVRAFEAWDIERGDAEVVVAMIDSGIDFQFLVDHSQCEGEEFRDNVYLNEAECCATPGCAVSQGSACVPGASANSLGPIGNYGDCPIADMNADGCPGACGVDDDNDGAADMLDPDVRLLYENGMDDDGDGLADEPAIVAGVTVDCASVAPGELLGAPPEGDCDGAANDDDENGYPDDCRGWNFGRVLLPQCDAETEPGACLYQARTTHPNQPMDTHGFRAPLSGHGRHVARIIGEPADDCQAWAGMAHHVKVMPLAATRHLPPDVAVGGAMIADLAGTIEAMVYAGKNGAHIINSSYGIPPNFEVLAQFPSLAGSSGQQLITDMIAMTGTDHVLHVVGAGNDSEDIGDALIFPGTADISNKVLVAASDSLTDEPLDFSNYGSVVDLAAPGDSVLGFAGTSAAAPVVSGAAALLLSHRPELRGRPALAAEILKDTARVVGSWGGLSATGGILDVEAALMADVPSALLEEATSTLLPAPVSIGTFDIDLFDADNDGDLDLFETHCSGLDVVGQPHLYINQAGAFTDRTVDLLPAFEGSFCDADFGDIDGDGWTDIVLGASLPFGSPSYNENQVLMNTGGAFVLESSLLPADDAGTRSVSLCDVDADGDLDLYVGNVGTSADDQLFSNAGGTFVDISDSLEFVRPSLAPAKILCADLSDPAPGLCDGLSGADCALCKDPGLSLDGLVASGKISAADEADCRETRSLSVPEIVVAGTQGAVTVMLRRAGDGTMQDTSCDLNLPQVDGSPIIDCPTNQPGRQDHDVEAVDINGDGLLDLVFATQRGNRNTLLLNTGSGIFTEATASNWTTAGDSSLDVEVGDLDGNGWPDLLITRGDPEFMNPGQSAIFLNNAGVLVEAPGSGLGTGFAVTPDGELADIDDDGDLDVLIGRYGETNQVYLNSSN